MTASDEKTAGRGLKRFGRLRRRVGISLHIAAGISLALWAAMGLAFARGGWETGGSFNLDGQWDFRFNAGLDEGLSKAEILHWWPTPFVDSSPYAMSTDLYLWTVMLPQVRIGCGDLEAHYWPQTGNGAGGTHVILGRRLDIQVPYEDSYVALLILPTVMWVLLPVRRRGIGAIRRLGKRDASKFTVAVDLTCVHCGYNLRTQDSEGRCTECGAAVADSLAAGRDLSHAPPAWLRCVAMGSRLLLLSRLVAAVTLGLAFENSDQFRETHYCALCCVTAAAALYGIGIFFVTSPEFPHLLSSRRRRARRLRLWAGLSLGCLAAGLGEYVIDRINSPAPTPWSLPWQPSFLATILIAAAWIGYCGCVVSEFSYLAMLAGRLGDDLLKRWCFLAGAGFATSSIGFILQARTMVPLWARWPTNIFTRTLYAIRAMDEPWWLIATVDLLMAAWFAFLLWTAWINLDFATRFSKKAGELQKQSSGKKATKTT